MGGAACTARALTHHRQLTHRTVRTQDFPDFWVLGGLRANRTLLPVSPTDYDFREMPVKSGYRQVRLWPKIWLKTNLVVHGRNEPLTRAEIALRGFDRSVTEQELDLLQFSSSSMAQAGTRTAQVMRG
jgi:hypothetical protein